MKFQIVYDKPGRIRFRCGAYAFDKELETAVQKQLLGLYMYRGIYYIGLNEIGDGSLWLTKAILIVMALPMGLVAARLCTDKNFRHCT